MAGILALLLSVPLGVLAVLFAVWATGSTWPFRDRAALARRISRLPAAEATPHRGMLGLTAAALGFAALVPWGLLLAPDAPVWQATATGAAWLAAAVFAFSGLSSYTIGPPFSAGPAAFQRRDRLVYGPFFLALAAGFMVLSALAG